MLNEAFEALQKYDWGTDRAPLAPIEDAIAASHGNEKDRNEIESRLLKSLASEISRDAKDYVCRKLAIVGSSHAVPALQKLLSLPHHSHMARYALERIPGPVATQALTETLSSVNDALKVGILSSIGSRRDATAIKAIATELNSSSAEVKKAAAIALGTIGTTEAAMSLGSVKPSAVISDAQLMCAEALLASNHVEDAKRIYSALSVDNQTKIVRVAATRGVLACLAKQSQSST